MAKGLLLYDNWTTLLAGLPEAQAGQLIKALCAIHAGADYEVEDQTVQAMVNMIAPKIIEDAETYRQNGIKRAEAGRKGGQTTANRKQNEANAKQNEANADKKEEVRRKKEDVRSNTEEERSNNPSPTERKEKPTPNGVGEKKPLIETLLPSYDLSSVLENKVREWIAYKQERREPYKEQGLKALLSKIARMANDYGDDAVADAIDTAMSSGYKGIVWDKVQKPRSGTTYADAIEHRFDALKDWVPMEGAI